MVWLRCAALQRRSEPTSAQRRYQPVSARRSPAAEPLCLSQPGRAVFHCCRREHCRRHSHSGHRPSCRRGSRLRQANERRWAHICHVSDGAAEVIAGRSSCIRWSLESKRGEGRRQQTPSDMPVTMSSGADRHRPILEGGRPHANYSGCRRYCCTAKGSLTDSRQAAH